MDIHGHRSVTKFEQVLASNAFSSPAEARRALDRRLATYRLDSALRTLGSMTTVFSNARLLENLPERELFPRVVNWHQMAYVAKRLIQISDDARPATLTPPEYLECALIYNAAQGEDYQQVNSSQRLDEALLRSAYQQLAYQSEPWTGLARSLVLFRDIAGKPPYCDKLDIPGAFREITGITVDAFVRAGALVIAGTWATRFRSFRREHVLQLFSGAFDPAVFEAFLARTSATYQEFRAATASEESDSPLSMYSFNPLESKPIVRTPGDEFICPIAPLLAFRCGVGLYHDLLRDRGKKFTDAFGAVFEAYVGDLLNCVFAPDQLMHEPEYGPPGRRARATDWIVLDGDYAILLECKAKRLRLQTKVTADRDLLTRDLIMGVVEALREMRTVMRAIEARLPGLDRLAGKRLLPVVLFYEPHHLANMPGIRSIVAEQLEQLHGITGFDDYQVVAVDELESTLEFLTHRGLGRVLAAKASDARDPVSGTKFQSLRTYVSQIAKGQEGSRLPVLQRRITALIDSLLVGLVTTNGTSSVQQGDVHKRRAYGEKQGQPLDQTICLRTASAWCGRDHSMQSRHPATGRRRVLGPAADALIT
jgi:hypothetical protein